MIITVSDYLLEQEISEASCDEIALEQSLAEFEVGKALVEAYAKQTMMLEYASDAYLEADGSSEDKWYKKVWEAIKKAWHGFIGFFVNLWTKFIGLFKKKKNGTSVLDDTIENLSKFPEEAKKNFKCKVKKPVVAKIDGLVDLAADFDDLSEKAAELVKAVADSDDISESAIDSAKNAFDEMYERVAARFSARINPELAKKIGEKGDVAFASVASNQSNSEGFTELDYDETVSMLKELREKMTKLPNLDKLKEISKMHFDAREDFYAQQKSNPEKVAEIKAKRKKVQEYATNMVTKLEKLIAVYSNTLAGVSEAIEHAYKLSLKYAEMKKKRDGEGHSANDSKVRQFGSSINDEKRNASSNDRDIWGYVAAATTPPAK